MIALACLTLAAVCLLGRLRKHAIPLENFSKTILASLSNHVAILDRNGMIIAVNKVWENFARANGGTSSAVGLGCSYLDVCRGGADAGESTV
jgi:hypothetical protein